MKNHALWSWSLACLSAMTMSLSAEEPAVLVESLDNPVGVAVQPGTGDVFVSCNKAIHRLDKANGYQAAVAIDGFATDIYGKGPKYDIGPLGLAFINESTLAVGGGDQLDGAEVVRFFKVGPKSGHQTCGDAMAVSGPIAAGSDSVKGEGNYYAVAKVGDDIFVTCNGDDTKGWISKIEWKAGKPGPLTPFIATKSVLSVDAPTGITASKTGQLVVSQMGEISVPGDSLLCTYDPKTGKLAQALETGLSDVISIAYSPKTGKLYGVDFSWADVTKGGLFVLEVNGDKVKATKVADLMKPTAIAIDADGNGYVTIIGDPSQGGGKVLHFAGL